ncbi:transposase [Providencia sp. SP181]|uniref:transposase n=1 Tax=Providencia sp. SP181 TaxID=3136277 RepID=UPI003D266B8A
MLNFLNNDKNQSTVANNSRNGFSQKTLKTENGTLLIEVPRDRQSSFEPQLIKKHQTRMIHMDEQILSLGLLQIIAKTAFCSTVMNVSRKNSLYIEQSIHKGISLPYSILRFIST